MKKPRWTNKERFILISTILELFDGTNPVTTQDILRTGKLNRSASSITNEMLRFKKAYYGCWRIKDGKQRESNVNKRRTIMDVVGVELHGAINLTNDQIVDVPPKGTRITNYRDVPIPDNISNGGSIKLPRKQIKTSTTKTSVLTTIKDKIFNFIGGIFDFFLGSNPTN